MTTFLSDRALHPSRTALLGDSHAMQLIRSQIVLMASQVASVIITGPSGSGKECVARALHHGGPRRDMPFIAVNCGAIPRDLIESELFGHERGSFTGASASRAGRFEQANGGTLFLDEIGDMPVDMQVRLLRVIEDRAVQRVGSNRSIPLDVRIISATHRDLDTAIAERTFREDLFYRLAVVPITLPPLCDRPEDIAPLIAHFAEGLAPGRLILNSAALNRLIAHRWPGNVRELRNVVERAVILHAGELVDEQKIDSLLDNRRRHGASAPLGKTPAQTKVSAPIDLTAELARIESAYIREALTRSGGVVAATARLLGLRRTTLVEKMRRHDLGRSEGLPLATAA